MGRSLLALVPSRPTKVKAFIMAASRSMESRVGRTKQRYAETGERLVAGVVPLNSAKTHVLLIQSTRRAGWVLPKGGWESDESCTEAAQRETGRGRNCLQSRLRSWYHLGDPSSEADVERGSQS